MAWQAKPSAKQCNARSAAINGDNMAKKRTGYTAPAFGSSITARWFNCSATQAALINKACSNPDRLTPSEYAAVCRAYYIAMLDDTTHPCRSCLSRRKCCYYDIDRTAACRDWIHAPPPTCRFGERVVTRNNVAPRPRRARRKRRSAKMHGKWPSFFNGPPCQGGSCTPK